jgi:uncharacterized protein YkwD
VQFSVQYPEISQRLLEAALQRYRLATVLWIAILASVVTVLKVNGQTPVGMSSGVSINSSSQDQTSLELVAAYSGCGGVTAPAVREDFEQQVIELVNKARAAEGLPPLKRADSLVEAARYHATDMLMDGYFEHDSYDNGISAPVCPWYTRVIGFYSPDWRQLSENIAAGQVDPDRVVRDWMNSSGHRKNILSSATWEIGVGYASAGSSSHYWVQDFGRREGVYPLVINHEAALTETRTVDLYIYGDWQEMRLRNDDGAWSEWRTFQNRLSWMLNTGTGERQVQVELRSMSGLTALSSDSIFLSGINTQSSLSDLPGTINFIYSKSQDRLYPSSLSVIIQSNGSSEVLEWTASLEGVMFQVSPTSGCTPQSISITPQNYENIPAGQYQEALTISASGGGQELDSIQIIQLSLLVTDKPVIQLFLPAATR